MGTATLGGSHAFMAQNLRRNFLRILRLALIAAVLVLLYKAWQAVLEESGADQFVVPLQVTQAGEAQLFFDTGAGFSERDSVRRTIEPTKGLTEVAFPVVRATLREVRFDPLPAAGEFRIGAPRLESPLGRVLVKIPIEAIVARNEIAGLRRDGDALAGKTVPGATDPQLTFALTAPLAAGQARLPWIEAGAVVVLAALTSFLKRETK